MEGFENAMTTRSNPNAICFGSESSAESKFSSCKCNNNIGDCSFGGSNREIQVNCACLKENRQNDGNISVEITRELRKRRGLKKRKFHSKRSTRQSENNELCQTLNEIKEENKSREVSSEHNLSTVGGDGEEKRQERARCRQHELNPSSNEINRFDVTTSCDLTSVIKSKSECCDEESNQNKNVNKDCFQTRMSSCSVFQSTCSEGSCSRRKHHKHHKHKKRSSSPVQSESDAPISPKVNPIFLWVRQVDTKIVEVLCEDYDHRNRLRLTRTHLGWRAIPKTKTFAKAIIPKALPAESQNSLENSVKPKRVRRIKKRKKTKKKKEPKNVSDNRKQIKECSVALCRDESSNSEAKDAISNSPESKFADDNVDTPLESKSYLAEPETRQSLNQSRPSSPESIFDSSKSLNNFRKLTKSNSCDFASLRKGLKRFPRSISLDFKYERDNIDFKVQKGADEANKANAPKELSGDFKSECEVEKELFQGQAPSTDGDPLCETEFEKSVNQRNHSDSVVVDMTKRDLDFNDTDCDELGQLLKDIPDIPDLEFVEEEEELPEIDEVEEEEEDEEEWLKPTDLTVQKPSTENEISGIKLPATITPVVTVTSSVKPPEPLTAPLPEVTITPIPKPKQAHQQKPQNNFLENLLSSSHSIKPENSEPNISQKKQSKPFKFSQYEKKALKHPQGNEPDSEVKNKKLKVEDITLKNLLSRHQSGRTAKPAGLESCIQKLKAVEGEECSNSRLKELLTDSVSSDPITQLKEVLSNPLLSVPDPLLVPRARLPALVASPASEIPRLLSMHLEKTIEETPTPPVTDSDILEVSLSNLQSLLSCSPEKLKSAKTQDITKYQKSLENFLEWQRYQSELMETQLKNSKSILSGFPADISDVAAATAFSQMLWLPYLNQFDYNCNANRDFMSIANSMLLNDYQANCSKLSAPPQINTNQVSQPSPFLTPTSPMEFESHLKTLSMWQEALMMQQNSQFARACTKVSPASGHQDVRKSGKFSHAAHPAALKKLNPEPNLQGLKATTVTPISSRVDSIQNNNFDCDIYQDAHYYQNDYYKRQNRQNSFQHRFDHPNHVEIQQKWKPEIQNQFRRMHQHYSNYRSELLKQCKVSDKSQYKKPGPMPGSISVKPLANLIDRSNLSVENRSFWEQAERDSNMDSDFARKMASRLMQFNTQIQRTTRREEKPFPEVPSEPNVKPHFEKRNPTEVKPCLTETPKLKVKNLVDPSKSPPKLLKQIAPEHVPGMMDDKIPVQDDGQANLWHPLFGSLSNGRREQHSTMEAPDQDYLSSALCTSRNNYVKNWEPGFQRGRYSPQIDLSRLLPGLKKIMKQLPSIKRKLTSAKKSEVVSTKQQQNGQHKKKVKKPLIKRTAAESHKLCNLNVNERPVRKKKKTKKYECYERNGKSPEPEIKHETNLLLALGLTPVNKEDSEKSNLNTMHVMEEGNGKITADAAELPETQPDLPKKANIVGKELETVVSSEDSPAALKSSSPVLNGVQNEATWISASRNSSETKSEFEKDDSETRDGVITVKRPPSTSIEIKREPGGKADSKVAEEEEKEREKCLEPQDLTVTCTPNFDNSLKTSQNEKHYSNNKIISISVEQCQTNSSPVNSIPEDLKKPKPISNRKRSNKSTDSEESYKTSFKRSKFPDVNYDERERTVNEYVEKATGSSLEELQMNTEKLQQEIHSLSALARAKELEWNDIIRLKKVKEEIYLRLVRRKQVMLLSMSGSGRMSDAANWDFASENRMSDFVTNDEVSYNRIPSSVSPKPPPRIPSNLTITKSQNNPNQNLQRFLMQPPQGNSENKSNTSLMMVPVMSSSPISISSTSSYLSRPQLPTPLKIPIPDRDKLKGSTSRNVPVPILPKPNQNVNHSVNNHSPPIGRQGPIVDVKSIIADYRQNHPEQVPRRGRRPKGQPTQNFADTMISSGRGVLSMSSLALGSGAQVRTAGSNSDLASASGQNSQESSRPSSADSNRSSSNVPNEVGAASGVSFKDVLVQFAKMSQHQQGSDRRNSTPPAKFQTLSKAAPYPEVTLHPVLPADGQSSNASSSLLHGILTKNNISRSENPVSSRSTTFSPTLARLLTTPDRSSMSTTITTALRGSSTNTTPARIGAGPVSITDLLSTSKNRNELTITPIISNLQPAKLKEDAANASDEDPDDNADRLVIDESEEQDARGEEEDVDSETVPECQGCHMKSAQFVCAGCGNQWYCSRNCQVSAWDEHSEVCSG